VRRSGRRRRDSWAVEDLDGRALSDVVAGARVVKAANTRGEDLVGAEPTGPRVSARCSFLATTLTRTGQAIE
jgi:hypothetical protein